MRAIAHIGVFTHIGVIAQGCVKKARTKLFHSIFAQVSELVHMGAIAPRTTHFGRDVAVLYIAVFIIKAPLYGICRND